MMYFTTSYSQDFTVSYDNPTKDPIRSRASLSWNIVTTSGQSYSVNGRGTKTVNGRPISFSLNYTYTNNPDEECSDNISKTLSGCTRNNSNITFTGTASCIGPNNPPDIRFSFTGKIGFRPSKEVILTGPNPKAFCDDASFVIKSSSNLDNYNWFISYRGTKYAISPTKVNGRNYEVIIDFPTVKGAISSYERFELFSVTVQDGCVSESIGQYSFNPPQALPSVTPDLDVNCFGESLPSITFRSSRAPVENEAFEYEISGTTFDEKSVVINLPSSQRQQTFTSDQLKAGTYSVILQSVINGEVRQSTGCRAVEPVNFTISQPEAELQIFPEKEDENCPANDDGKLTINATGGTLPYQYAYEGSSSSVDFQNNKVFTDLEAGTYTAKVKDSKGCIKTEEIIIDEPENLEVTNTNLDSAPTCINSEDGEITITLQGGTRPYSFNTSLDSDVTTLPASENKITIEDLPVGLLTVNIEDSNQCPISTAVNLPAPDSIKATISKSDPICYGGNGTITISDPNGGTGKGYKFSLDDSVFTSDRTFQRPAGNYTVYGKDDSNCASFELGSIAIQNPKQIKFSVIPVRESCPGKGDGSLTVTNVQNANGYIEYSIDGGDYQSSNVFDELTSTSYTVWVRDALGCENSTTFFLPINDPLSLEVTKSDYNGQGVSCFGAKNGFIEVTASGGSGEGYTYSWDHDASLTSNRIENLGIGDYTATVTDSRGCVTSSTIIIAGPQPLTVGDTIYSDYNGFEISCTGEEDGNIEVIASGGTEPYSYEWRKEGEAAVLSNDAFILNQGIGSYSVLITDVNGCSVEENYTLTQPEPLSLELASKTDVDCNGNANGIIELQASGGVEPYQYALNGGNLQADAIFENLDIGGYEPMVEDANGCTFYLPAIQITQPEVLTASIVDTTSAECSEPIGSAEISISGGTAPFQIDWYSPSNELIDTGLTLNNVLGGVYRAVVTDAQGCGFSMNVPVSSIDGAEITVTAIRPTLCHDSQDGGASLSLSGFEPFTVEWENGETGLQANSLPAGPTIVSVTDANNCTVTQIIEIPSPEPLVVQKADEQVTSCFESTDGSMRAEVSGGTPPYRYQWSTGDTTAVLSDVPQGDYLVTVTDANECTLSSTLTLNGPDSLYINVVELNQPVCTGEANASITVEGVGGNGDYTYTWEDGTTGPIIEGLSAGDYSVTITDRKGCVAEKTITVEEPILYTIEIPESVGICSGSSYAPEFNFPNAATYSWTSTTGFTSVSNAIDIAEPGTYFLEVVSTAGCIARDTLSLQIKNDLLRADYIMSTEGYVGDTIMLIDISWPVPENVGWYFPEQAIVVDSTKDYASIVFNEQGNYEIEMNIQLGECQDQYSQQIKIVEHKDNENSQARGSTTNSEKLFKSLSLYPNPTKGPFTAELTVNRAAEVSMQLIDLGGNYVVKNQTFNLNQSKKLAFERGLKSGLYMLRFTSGKHSIHQRVIIR